MESKKHSHEADIASAISMNTFAEISKREVEKEKVNEFDDLPKELQSWYLKLKKGKLVVKVAAYSDHCFTDCWAFITPHGNKWHKVTAWEIATKEEFENLNQKTSS